MTRTFDIDDGSCWYCGHVETASCHKNSGGICLCKKLILEEVNN